MRAKFAHKTAHKTSKDRNRCVYMLMCAHAHVCPSVRMAFAFLRTSRCTRTRPGPCWAKCLPCRTAHHPARMLLHSACCLQAHALTHMIHEACVCALLLREMRRLSQEREAELKRALKQQRKQLEHLSSLQKQLDEEEEESKRRLLRRQVLTACISVCLESDMHTHAHTHTHPCMHAHTYAHT